MQRQTLYNVQALRFLAAAAVATSHVADLLIAHDTKNVWFWAVPWTAGVDLFFVISGFIMLLLTHGTFGSRQAAVLFLRRRAARLVPSYWLFSSLIVGAVLLSGGKLKGTTAAVDQIVTSFAFLPWPRDDGKLNPILAQGWTLNYEAFFYVAFAIALLNRRGAILLSVAFCALAGTHTLWSEQLFMLRFWSSPIIVEFVAGMGLAHLYVGGKRLSDGGALLLVALAIALFVALAYIDLGAYNRVARLGLPALLICAGMFFSREPSEFGPVRRFIRLGGDASYSLYLSHYAIVNLIAMIWKRIGVHLPWLGVALGLIASIFFAIAFHLYVERRMTSWVRRRMEPDRLAMMA
jgi:peptidoglycan/LPS O-acetylase OafA/YrhL